jgi:preprotein translocase subunit SecA
VESAFIWISRYDCWLYWQPPTKLGRKKAYNADITYGTNNEFGFDYLRDNMAHSPDDLVQNTIMPLSMSILYWLMMLELLIISGPVPQGDRHEFNELKPKLKT